MLQKKKHRKSQKKIEQQGCKCTGGCLAANHLFARAVSLFIGNTLIFGMKNAGKEGTAMRRILTTFMHCILILLTFYILFYLSHTVFTLYLFIWTAHNNYLYLWVICVILTIFRKPLVAYSITVGNVAGVIIGQYLGDYIQAVRSAKITDTMSVEMIYYLENHYGAFIWLLVILVSIAVGILLQIRYTQKHSSSTVNVPKVL